MSGWSICPLDGTDIQPSARTERVSVPAVGALLATLSVYAQATGVPEALFEAADVQGAVGRWQPCTEQQLKLLILLLQALFTWQSTDARLFAQAFV